LAFVGVPCLSWDFTSLLVDESSAKEIDLLDLFDLLDEKGLMAEPLVSFAERITPAFKVSDHTIAFDEHIPIFVFFQEVVFLLVEDL
jgi:hypothetical protein